MNWEPHVPRSPRGARIHKTSCCGEYEFASEGGEYFVLRSARGGKYQEVGRGLYANALEVWKYFIACHNHKEDES
jgi:hypothetical protein